ncbi:chemotaxis protein CheB [Dactylosporangium sp. NPDC051541]|uniref:chemotaxis protein CheB n=1 Tax=Dactylosporangium sp. NPDC051541 TaxID=3363977 RepID=UPI0037B37EA7
MISIGGSAGAVEALQYLVAGLPADLDAAVLVTVHITATARSALPQILTRAGPLPATHARNGASIAPGSILVAPPDRHLLLHEGRVRLSAGPKVNRHRPSVDVMLASAARWAGPDLISVVLSGALDDGAVGAALTARAGGRVMVQRDARFPGMPAAAQAAVPAATAIPLAELAPALCAAIRPRPAAATRPGAGPEGVSMSMADSDDPLFLSADESRLTRLVCPDCSGSLAQVDLPAISYYRCHVGHQWSPQHLAAAQAETVEAKLWTAVAALEEQAAFLRHLAGGRHPATAGEATEHREAADRAAELARLITGQLDYTPSPAPEDHNQPGATAPAAIHLQGDPSKPGP